MRLDTISIPRCLDHVARSFPTSPRTSFGIVSRSARTGLDNEASPTLYTPICRSILLISLNQTRVLSSATTIHRAFHSTTRNDSRPRARKPNFRRISVKEAPPQQLVRTREKERSYKVAETIPQILEGNIVFPFHYDDLDKANHNKPDDGITTKTASSESFNSDSALEDPFFPKHIRPGTVPVNTHIPRSKASTVALEEELKWTAYNQPNLTIIKNILTILIQDRKIKPTSEHYEALILANCNPEEGSADNVQNILAEMEEEGLEISGNIYTAALFALAIHPSISLMTSILSTLQARWIPQTPSMTHAVIISLIRTSQLELANDLLNNLHQTNKPLPIVQRTPIPKYLYVLLIQALVEKKDYEAVMRWIYRLRDRKAMDMHMPPAFWGWVLERSAMDGDGWVSGWVWQGWVENMKIRPTRLTCVNMLSIAARDGVAWLAESVRDVIKHGGFVEAVGKEVISTDSPTSGSEEKSMDHFEANCFLTVEEEKLVDLAYQNLESDIQGEQTETEQATKDSEQMGDRISTAEKKRERQIKLGNMWPLFTDIEGYGSPRFDPWKALGPKSKS